MSSKEVRQTQACLSSEDRESYVEPVQKKKKKKMRAFLYAKNRCLSQTESL